MRQSTRRDLRNRGLPARTLFPPLPSQSEIWREESAARLMRNSRFSGFRPGETARNRLSLPALPFAEVLMPFGMLTLSLLG